MKNKIIGDLSVSDNIKINNKNAIRSINSINADQNGNVNIQLYKQEDVDKIVSTLPISRVGTMDYLPLNINGSFEGASNYAGKNIYPVLLENDGTLVYLRPGTNGSVYNYFYCYIKNARTSIDLKPILSNEKYIPSFFTNNHKITSFVASNASEVLMMKTNDGTQDNYAIGITNKTMNSVAHQYVEFPSSMMPNTDPQYALISNGLVYILCLDGYTYTTPFVITVYTISVQDVINGVYTSLTKVTGFNGNNIFNEAITNSPNINLANMYFSTNINDKSWICIPAGNSYTGFLLFHGSTQGSIHAEKDDTDNIRIAFMRYTYVATSSRSVSEYSVLSLNYNTTSKNYSIDNTVKGQCVITTDSSGNITYGNPYNNSPTKYYGTYSNTRVPSFVTTTDGVQFSAICSTGDVPNAAISRCNITNFTNTYDSWNVNTYNTESMIISSIPPYYGSPIGENLLNPTIISASKIILSCSGTQNNISYGYDGTAYTSFDGLPNFQYKSLISGGTINGYKPNTDRSVLSNTSYKYNACISIVNEDGSTEVYGSSFLESVAKYSALEMDQNTLQYSQQISLGPSVLSNLKNEMISSVTLPYNILSSRVVLYYVPNTSYTKSYAVLTAMIDSPSGSNTYLILSEVDIILTGTVVTGYSLISSYMIGTSIRAVGSIAFNYLNRQNGLTIAKYQDFTYVGMCTVASIQTVGNTSLLSLLCKVDNSTKLISNTPKIVSNSFISSSPNTYCPGVIPNIGFGLFENGAITDLKTKLVFKNFGTTEAQFDAMFANFASSPIERIVIAAQDVPEGYVVYFTQEIPALLNGKFYKIPAQSINLQDIFQDVQDKTFYMYININNDSPEYIISESELSEELYRTYIGTIVTDTIGITSISSEKVTRFLTYRTSTSKRGSAIPTSTGVPSSTGTRWN